MIKRLKVFKEEELLKEWKDWKNIPSIFDGTPLEPTQIFDNLYCIGTRSVVIWVIKTLDGIILIDSMWDNDDAKIIESGIKKLKLNPEEINYIVITHGHGDHYGGANYLKKKYTSQVFMSELDTKLMNNKENQKKFPTSEIVGIDKYIVDNEIIKLGEQEIKILATPGHTLGCLSLEFTVSYKNRNYKAILWGGTGAPKEKKLKEIYLNTILKYKNYVKENEIEVLLISHLHRENGYEKLRKVKNLTSEDKNPFILEKEQVIKFFNELEEEVKRKI